jgi:hypothetical protein
MEALMLKLILLTAFLTTPVFAQDQTATSLLAAGCGPDEAKFDVKIDKKLHPTAQPAEGKALMYVFADQEADNAKLVVGPVITRIGADGNWVGALKLKSYFYVPMEPGDHRLCASVQSKLESRTIKYAAATTFTAEAGKTYYFRTKTPYRPQPGDYVQLVPVDAADAQLRIASAALSISDSKK